MVDLRNTACIHTRSFIPMFIHTFTHEGQSSISNPPTCMLLFFLFKQSIPENCEKTHANIQRTCKLCTNSNPSSGLSPEAKMLQRYAKHYIIVLFFVLYKDPLFPTWEINLHCLVFNNMKHHTATPHSCTVKPV